MKPVIVEWECLIEPSDSAAGWQPQSGACEALARLNEAGFSPVIVAHHPGLSEGTLELDTMEAMHEGFAQQLELQGGSVAAWFYCPHASSDACKCRFPQTGLIDVMEAEFALSASEVPFIGVSAAGLEAADRKDCNPVMIAGEHTPVETTPVCADLRQAAEWIIERYSSSH